MRIHLDTRTATGDGRASGPLGLSADPTERSGIRARLSPVWAEVRKRWRERLASLPFIRVTPEERVAAYAAIIAQPIVGRVGNHRVQDGGADTDAIKRRIHLTHIAWMLADQHRGFGDAASGARAAETIRERAAGEVATFRRRRA